MERANKNNIIKEEEAIVLDILSTGFSKNEVVQSLGCQNFVLLELIPKSNSNVSFLEKVYIGEEKRDKIQYVKRSISYEDLSDNSKTEILSAIEEIVKNREDEIVNIINRIGPINIRKHGLELINGVGKKNLKNLIEIREESKFLNFEDISKRCSFIQNPIESISKRILEEIKGEDLIKIFVR